MAENVIPTGSKESHGRPDWFGFLMERLYHQWEEQESSPFNTPIAQGEMSRENSLSIRARTISLGY